MISHLVARVPMARFDPISTSKLRSTFHYRYSIVIKVGVGNPLIYFLFSRSVRKIANSVYSQFCIMFRYIAWQCLQLI